MGSEMCIRDSLRSVTPQGAHAPTAASPFAHAAARTAASGHRHSQVATTWATKHCPPTPDCVRVALARAPQASAASYAEREASRATRAPTDSSRRGASAAGVARCVWRSEACHRHQMCRVWRSEACHRHQMCRVWRSEACHRHQMCRVWRSEACHRHQMCRVWRSEACHRHQETRHGTRHQAGAPRR